MRGGSFYRTDPSDPEAPRILDEYRVYLGHICHHHDPAEGPACVQPKRESQAGGMEPPCIPFDPARAEITVLPGKLGNYA